MKKYQLIAYKRSDGVYIFEYWIIEDGGRGFTLDYTEMIDSRESFKESFESLIINDVNFDFIDKGYSRLINDLPNYKIIKLAKENFLKNRGAENGNEANNE